MIPFPEGAKLVLGIALPATEIHFEKMIRDKSKVGLVDGRGTYQLHKLRKALEDKPGHPGVPLDRRNVVVDVGCQVGLWAYHFAKAFRHVVGFEPVPIHHACWDYNMAGVANVTLHKVALGNRAGSVVIEMPDHTTGHAHIRPDDPRLAEGGVTCEAALATLDSFALADVDLIKIDVEGTEKDVLEGAADTLARCKPWVIVEQKGNDRRMGRPANEAVSFLAERGWTVAWNYSGDHLMAPPK
jgi:FkbM family methyltransferase